MTSQQLEHAYNYLLRHNINVIECKISGIVVEHVYCVDGVAVVIEETIEPKWAAVRAWLGY